MSTRLRSALGAGLLVLFGGSTAEAQVFTPTFTSPRLVNEIGLYLSDGPGDLAIEGLWRGGPLGLRVGYVDARDGYISVGGELRAPLMVGADPLALAFVAGAQGLVGDDGGIGVQGGLSAGYTFRGTGLLVTPYMHPRIGAVRNIGPGRDMELEVMADVGADFEFAQNILLRLGIVLGDIGSSWGVGFSLRR
jgi:hypothetical protein